MSYLGLEPSLQLFKKMDFTGTGSTTSFNLGTPVSSERGLLVIAGGVPQEPVTAYTVTNTPYAYTLEFSTAPALGVDIWAIWLGSPDPVDIDLNNYALLDSDNAWTGSQRSPFVTITDATLIDMDAGQNFGLTLAGADVLSFDNITNGQSGIIRLVNSSSYAVTKAAHVECDTDFLATVSTAGTYIVGYCSYDGVTVSVTTSAALAV